MRRYLLLALLASLALPVAAQRCNTALNDADEQYRTGEFDEAIERLTTCLDRNAFSDEERRRAFRLLGLAYIGKDRENDARSAVRSLLEVAPDYQPDPAVDPPPFVAMVAEVKRNQRSGPGRQVINGSSQGVSSTEGFQIGFTANGTAYSDSDNDSASGGGGTLTVGYGITPSIALLVQLGGSAFSKFGEYIGPAGEDATGTLGTASLGGRFHIGSGQKKLVPYIGAGAAFQTLALDFGSGVTGDYSGGGGLVEGGVLYFFSPSLALNGGVQAVFTSLAPDGGNSFSATTVNVGVGITYSSGR